MPELFMGGPGFPVPDAEKGPRLTEADQLFCSAVEGRDVFPCIPFGKERDVLAPDVLKKYGTEFGDTLLIKAIEKIFKSYFDGDEGTERFIHSLLQKAIHFCFKDRVLFKDNIFQDSLTHIQNNVKAQKELRENGDVLSHDSRVRLASLSALFWISENILLANLESIQGSFREFTQERLRLKNDNEGFSSDHFFKCLRLKELVAGAAQAPDLGRAMLPLLAEIVQSGIMFTQSDTNALILDREIFSCVAPELFAADTALFDKAINQIEDGFRREEGNRDFISTAHAPLLASNNELLRLRSVDSLSRVGFPVNERMVNVWRKCDNENADSLRSYIESAIYCIEDLERKRPGATNVLRKEFGIVNFARYPSDILIEQYDTREDNALPYGIMINPYSDYNGAFKWNVFPNFQRRCRMRIFEAGSRLQVAKTLLKSRDRYAAKSGKMLFALIGGHGKEDSIRFGSGDEAAFITTKDLGGGGVKKMGGEFFDQDATIILRSCFTGRNHGIGQQLSAVLGLHVIAPEVDTGTRKIDVSFLPNGKPSFNVIFAKGDSRTYRAGQPAMNACDTLNSA